MVLTVRMAENNIRFEIRIPASLAKQIRIAAAHKGKTANELAAETLAKQFAKSK